MHKSIAMTGLTMLSLCAVAGVTLPSTAQAQESLGGLGAASGISSSMNAQSAGSSSAAMNSARGSGGSGEMGSGSEGSPGAGSGGSEGAAGGAGAAPVVTLEPRRWGPQRGSAFLSELLAGRRPVRPIPAPLGKARSPRRQATLSRNLKKMPDRQRTAVVMEKYDVPPVGWLKLYLPEDRYKVTSKAWQYVSIEDDAGKYPVRFYYRPWASTMLQLLQERPSSRVPSRANRVIGFRTWQDAMIAGYRPDPVTRPEPGRQVAYLASLTRSPQLETYVEYVYAGQMTPETFTRNYSYIRQVATIVSSHKHTRPLLGQTIAQVLGAALGQGSVPESVGGPPPQIAPMNPEGMPSGTPSEMPSPNRSGSEGSPSGSSSAMGSPSAAPMR